MHLVWDLKPTTKETSLSLSLHKILENSLKIFSKTSSSRRRRKTSGDRPLYTSSSTRQRSHSRARGEREHGCRAGDGARSIAYSIGVLAFSPPIPVLFLRLGLPPGPLLLLPAPPALIHIPCPLGSLALRHARTGERYSENDGRASERERQLLLSLSRGLFFLLFASWWGFSCSLVSLAPSLFPRGSSFKLKASAAKRETRARARALKVQIAGPPWYCCSTRPPAWNLITRLFGFTVLLHSLFFFNFMEGFFLDDILIICGPGFYQVWGSRARGPSISFIGAFIARFVMGLLGGACRTSMRWLIYCILARRLVGVIDNVLGTRYVFKYRAALRLF